MPKFSFPLVILLFIPSPSIAQQAWEALWDGSTISVDTAHEYHPSEMRLSNGATIRGSKWSEFLEDFVLSLPEQQRDPVIDGLSRHWVEFDRMDRVIRFEPIRLMSGPYSRKSHIAAVGQITENRVTGALRIRYYGRNWIFANRVDIRVDDWTTSITPNFRRNNAAGYVWETVNFPLSLPETRELITRITNGEEALIRFRGERGYSDLEVTAAMKVDLAAILTMIETLEN
ncbi:hypothetical protein [Wenzhouxiangella marina]|uniref:Uncharacterized protein n=1 Tax=Wenzhouxiangella marina TaxID=1579979 RepID=A0A0K0XZ31_9GAMM|nr:hypothetical protein [Wenzhouxiangella marina]AKS42930.1 hypothetical protein WM2015_2572 [Wenzhouxiangella marina]MBB6087387.1 hypothetical protein [Wenzhouxiangella marina]